ncbi:MAG: FeoB-associated Cys-rich membrane protein [Lachnospiraceae bacterium]|nr:FeoB-associated Cys-rich membrane protein [Lachnospiraceae bacterium]
MGTIVVLAIVVFIVGLAIRSMYKDKKAGKSIQCGGQCKTCGGYCHQVKNMQGGNEE